MEGWLELCDDEAKSWSKKWCSLEGGYIWLFDCAEDNQKPQGQNNPRGMITINRCTVSMGCPPFFDVEQKPNMFTVTLSNKKPSCFSAPSDVDMCYWIEALSSKFK